MALRERIFTHRTPRVIRDVIHIRWEETLKPLMHPRRHISPPQKSLRQCRAIVGAHLEFHVSLAGVQANAVHAFHPSHRIVIAAPDRYRSVSVAFDLMLHWEERCRPMMLRPVEFDAAGNPWTGETDERRFDDVLVAAQIITIRFVLNRMNASAQLWQHQHAKKVILDPHRLPLAIHGVFRNAIGER
jgi:hypothetical protein